MYLILLGFLFTCSSPSQGVPILGNVIPERYIGRGRGRERVRETEANGHTLTSAGVEKEVAEVNRIIFLCIKHTQTHGSHSV